MTAVIGRGSTPRSSLVANSAVLSATMLAVSAGNYGLNLVLARLLPPAAFGDANLAINLVLAAAVVAATLQLVASKAVAADPGSREAVRRGLLRVAYGAGAVVALGLGGGAVPLAAALQTSTPWMFVILGIGLPVYFAQAVHRGALQGDLRITRLAVSYGVEALVRVVGAIALVWAGFGVIGASVGIAASFVASGLVARASSTRRGATPGSVPWSSLRPALMGATILLLGQVVINNGDLVLSKAFFDPATAGIYASAALIGRAVFFFSWSVVHAVFPVAARAAASVADRRRAIAGAVGLVLLIGLSGLVVTIAAGDEVARLLFGADYGAAAGLLAPYVLATSAFALANLLASVDVAVGRRGGPIALLGGAVLQTVLLVVLGSTPEAMVWAQVAAMGATALAVTAAWWVGERSV